MERSWWWKALLYGALVALACLYLVPTVVPEADQPALIKKYFQKRIQLGLDLQGGLHLVYEVHVDKAVSDKVDRIASEIEDRLKKDEKDKAPAVDVTISREGRDDIVITFKNPADQTKLNEDLLKEFRKQIDLVSRDTAKGVVRLRLDPDQVEDVRDSALRQGIETIRGRVDKFGVAEPTIIKKGTDIIVELPGLKTADFERIKNIIGKTAQLEFKIVDDGADYMDRVKSLVPKDSGIDIRPESWQEKDSGKPHEDVYLKAKTREALEKFFAGLTGDNAVPPDHEIGYEENAERNEAGEATQDRYWRTYYMKKRAVLTGEYLSNADQTWDQQTGRPEVTFEFDHQGAILSERMTRENMGRKMAIVLDDKINSAPVIEGVISSRGRITLGGFGDPFQLQQEAKDLVAVLKSGSLPAPLRKTFETQVGPTMGRDSIHKAKFSMLIGAAAVILFMLIYYRASGIIANIAMTINMLFMVAILAAFEASLTLPGIAGLVLTIGMAVDANIIIYERIREELRNGKSPRSAVDAGFSRAFWTVFDAHVTNFVAGVVLYSYGSGPIRGFAVTLLVGIITNLVTSYWLSRWLFDLMVGRRSGAPATLSI
jgi:preprotein translocase subunit SecD